MTEVWKECMHGYEVSQFGQIRRSIPGRKTFAGRILKQQLMSIGYYSVRPTVNGKNKVFYVHDLVAAAFIGEKPIGCSINHIDGVKTNNAASNLEYLTHAGNMAHAARTGLMVCGEAHPGSKITESDVRALRSDRVTGLSYSRLAKKYGISIAVAHGIAKGTRWSHVQ